MIEARHPKTAALAALLWRADLSDYERTAQAIEALFDNNTDEYKADLYAQLQDTLNRDDTFADTELKINRALRRALAFA